MTDDRRLLTDGRAVQELSDPMELQLRYWFSPEQNHTHDAIVHTAHQRKIHPFRDWLDKLKWDGKPRLSTMFHHHFHAADGIYTQALSRIFLIAACRRVRRPGCKFDHFVILEGPQGLGKSEGIRALAGEDYYGDDSLFRYRSSKERMEQMEGHVIIEFADLVKLESREIEEIKAFITRRVDQARMAWGRNSEIRQRGCIFVGTTNKEMYLKDLTGN
jgi:predicted P-loop ATPase